MNKAIAALLITVLCLLAACNNSEAPGETVEPTAEPMSSATPAPTPGPNQFVFTRENFPRMDGSTSMVPLAEAVASVLLGESREESTDLVSFNRTSQSFRNLMYGNCDILIVGAPAQAVFEEIEMAGFEYEMAHISTDALIFVVNEDNPVDSLTIKQIQDIYTGKITNWSEVGGNDIEIIPFQRNAEAGSQAAMERMVIGDLQIMKPPVEYIVDSMSGLMEAVKGFDGSAGAIGYSVYYYANDMRMAEGLKIICVEGVDPSPETIRSEQYPFLAPSYTVIAASAPEDSPERIMWTWLQGEEGQALVNSQGYVSVLEF